jgi:hypothetical protein
MLLMKLLFLLLIAQAIACANTSHRFTLEASHGQSVEHEFAPGLVFRLAAKRGQITRYENPGVLLYPESPALFQNCGSCSQHSLALRHFRRSTRSIAQASRRDSEMRGHRSHHRWATRQTSRRIVSSGRSDRMAEGRRGTVHANPVDTYPPRSASANLTTCSTSFAPGMEPST